jgi:hypothetical protein
MHILAFIYIYSFIENTSLDVCRPKSIWMYKKRVQVSRNILVFGVVVKSKNIIILKIFFPSK